MNARENVLRAVRFEGPQHIPMSFHINAACWHHYPQDALQELMASHPLLFPGFTPSAEPITPDFAPNARAGEPYTDPWGCVWETTDSGITGTVTEHPLADWGAFEKFTPPDPDQTDGRFPIDWAVVAERMGKVWEVMEGTDSVLDLSAYISDSNDDDEDLLLLCDAEGFSVTIVI